MYLQDMTELFWNFIKDVNTNYESNDLKNFESYTSIVDATKVNPLLFMKNSHLFEYSSETHKDIQKIEFSPDNIIFVFPDLDALFLGIQSLLAKSAKGKSAHAAVKKSIRLINNYQDITEISDIFNNSKFK